jgi:hypothetical protein
MGALGQETWDAIEMGSDTHGSQMAKGPSILNEQAFSHA